MERHIVYLAMRPVEAAGILVASTRDGVKQAADKLENAADKVTDALIGDKAKVIRKTAAYFRSMMRQYIEGQVTFAALFTMLVVEHWGIVVEDQYYHLRKKEEDNNLALDLTPFDKDEEFLRVPLWKTKLTHEERVGIALRILESMSKAKKADAIEIFQGDEPVSDRRYNDKKYRSYIIPPNIKGGGYNAVFNNCQQFGTAFLNQLYIPRFGGLTNWVIVSKEMLQLWFPNADDLKKMRDEVVKRLKDHTFTIEFLLEHLLRSPKFAIEPNKETTAVASN
jgi:hypothetical protein